VSDKSTSLQVLLEESRRGDAESLGLLLKKYVCYLSSLSRGHLDERVRCRMSASDIVQETLLEAHRDFQNFVGTSLQEFTGWLRKILFNNLSRAVEKHLLTAKRDVRRERSLREKTQGLDGSALRLEAILADRMPTPSSCMRRDESLRELALAVEELPDSYREVIRLRHFEGRSFQEIAVLMGRNPGATRMLWMRALEKLRLALPDSQ